MIFSGKSAVLYTPQQPRWCLRGHRLKKCGRLKGDYSRWKTNEALTPGSFSDSVCCKHIAKKAHLIPELSAFSASCAIRTARWTYPFYLRWSRNLWTNWQLASKKLVNQLRTMQENFTFVMSLSHLFEINWCTRTQSSLSDGNPSPVYIHGHLARIFTSVIRGKLPIPSWLVQGRMILIPKKRDLTNPKIIDLLPFFFNI